MKYKSIGERGFVALMSVIIISAILLVLIFTLGASSFFSRFDSLDAENKQESLGLAEACVNAAMLDIAQGDNFISEQPAVVVDSSNSKKTCRICEATSGGVILTRAVYNSSYTNLSLTISTTPGSFAVTNWSEQPTYSGPTCTVP